MKQVGAVTSAEIGSSVTMAVAVTASGNSILPFFVLPQNNYRDYFIGRLCWICEQVRVDDRRYFVLYMGNFVKHTRVT
jgi:hypothetical protein